MSEVDGTQLLNGLSDLKASIDLLRTELVRKDVYDEQRKLDNAAVTAVTEDVKELKDTQRWLVRVILPGLLLPLVTSFVMLYVSQQVIR